MLQDVVLIVLNMMLSLERNEPIPWATVLLKWHHFREMQIPVEPKMKSRTTKSDPYSQWYSRKLGRNWPLISKEISVAKYCLFLWESQSNCVFEVYN